MKLGMFMMPLHRPGRTNPKRCPRPRVHPPPDGLVTKRLRRGAVTEPPKRYLWLSSLGASKQPGE